MIDSQLMGEFEADARELEADSWSNTVDKKYLKQLKKDSIKRQDVIYGRLPDRWPAAQLLCLLLLLFVCVFVYPEQRSVKCLRHVSFE